EPIRKARFEKGTKLGVMDPKWGMAPQAGDWGKVENKPREIACMEVYAAMVDRMDQNIGKVVAALKEAGRLDDTLILFLQDNCGGAGAMGRHHTQKPPRRPPAGQTTPAPPETPEKPPAPRP